MYGQKGGQCTDKKAVNTDIDIFMSDNEIEILRNIHALEIKNHL